MEIENLSWNENVSIKNNHPLLPKSLRQGRTQGVGGVGVKTPP